MGRSATTSTLGGKVGGEEEQNYGHMAMNSLTNMSYSLPPSAKYRIPSYISLCPVKRSVEVLVFLLGNYFPDYRWPCLPKNPISAEWTSMFRCYQHLFGYFLIAGDADELSFRHNPRESPNALVKDIRCEASTRSMPPRISSH